MSLQIILEKLVLFSLIIVALKSLIIGSDFGFFYLIKYGRIRWDWYQPKTIF
jgi:hypothetical protein